ncbi:tetratricopeptide repeat protein [Phyllobacterium chamaecytisi]|uniref:tetratricopeptide repeat protein n=1 Tax=Phyllobacterium chamaecytisi TaxID=2876082 RepID=UPI001CCF2D3D|nr:hypothetical protein [Phyllobacterium sp. KW56]MBZ9601667.1 hypothetical protein [Phyllobacterium sp. KW56]
MAAPAEGLQHDGDFVRSVIEVEAAAKLVPYDAFAGADLAYYLVNAGNVDSAIEWLEESIRRDPTPMDWYFGYLAMVYYFAVRPAESVVMMQKIKEPWEVNLAAAYARLGKMDEAHASVARLLGGFFSLPRCSTGGKRC